MSISNVTSQETTETIVANAIRDSIGEGRIVHLAYAEGIYDALVHRKMASRHGRIEGVDEFWGVGEEGDEWRVRLDTQPEGGK